MTRVFMWPEVLLDGISFCGGTISKEFQRQAIAVKGNLMKKIKSKLCFVSH